MYRERKTSLQAFPSGYPPYPSVSSCAELLQSVRAHPVLTHVPTHLAPEISPPKWFLPAIQPPFPHCCKHLCWEGQGAIGKGHRRDAAERNGYLSSWKIKELRERKQLILKKERNYCIFNIMQKVCTKTSTWKFNIPNALLSTCVARHGNAKWSDLAPHTRLLLTDRTRYTQRF